MLTYKKWKSWNDCSLIKALRDDDDDDDDDDDLDGDYDANVGDGGDVDNWRIPVLGDCFSVSGAQGMMGPGYNLIASP